MARYVYVRCAYLRCSDPACFWRYRGDHQVPSRCQKEGSIAAFCGLLWGDRDRGSPGAAGPRLQYLVVNRTSSQRSSLRREWVDPMSRRMDTRSTWGHMGEPDPISDPMLRSGSRGSWAFVIVASRGISKLRRTDRRFAWLRQLLCGSDRAAPGVAWEAAAEAAWKVQEVSS